MAGKKRKHNAAAKQAHQKNLERAKYMEKTARRQAFLNKYRKQLTIGIPAAVVLILAVWLLCKAFIGPGGSIPNFFGHLQGVQDNWIVSNQGTSSSPRYYKMGTFTVPEGYTLDPEYKATSDTLAKTFYCRADDETASVKSFYVAGVQGGRSAAEMADTILGYGLYSGEAARQEGTLGGLNAVWVQGLVSDDENTETDSSEDTEEKPEMTVGHRQMTIYTDSVQGGCVLIYLSSASSTPAAEIPSEEDFLAAADHILSHLTIEK